MFLLFVLWCSFLPRCSGLRGGRSTTCVHEAWKRFFFFFFLITFAMAISLLFVKKEGEHQGLDGDPLGNALYHVLWWLEREKGSSFISQKIFVFISAFLKTFLTHLLFSYIASCPFIFAFACLQLIWETMQHFSWIQLDKYISPLVGRKKWHAKW